MPGSPPDITGLLVNTCRIKRKAYATTSAGFPKLSGFTTVGSQIPCSIQADDSREAQVALRETGERWYQGYFRPSVVGSGTNLWIDNISGIATLSGATLAADGPPVDDAGHGAYVRIPLKYRGGGGLQ